MDIQNLDRDKTAMQNVKQRFFALRNGLLADMLRKAGSPYRIIFGLNLPQLREVASAFGKDRELAEVLWANDTTRESRLMAPMLVDADGFEIEDARRWVAGLCGSPEEADLLCHGLLRHTPYVSELIDEMSASERPIARYAALRLMFGRLMTEPGRARELAMAEVDRVEPLTRPVAMQLLAEVDELGM